MRWDNRKNVEMMERVRRRRRSRRKKMRRRRRTRMRKKRRMRSRGRRMMRILTLSFFIPSSNSGFWWEIKERRGRGKKIRRKKR
jgi:hypothetical protein